MSTKDQKPGILDRSWHLATTPLEENVSELEYALMSAVESFERWQGECLASVIDLPVSGPENAMLHIIRMNDRPKTLKDIARLTNREDIANMQYSLRKLIAAGFISRSGSGRSGVAYCVTERGIEVTEHYAALRRSLLIEAVQSVPDFSQRLAEAAKTLDLMTGIYEQATRSAAIHRRFPK